MSSKCRLCKEDHTSQNKFTPSNIERVTGNAGVYAFWYNYQCLYVGQSRSLNTRLEQHRNDPSNECLAIYMRDYGSEIKFCYQESSLSELDNMEKEFIDILNPECNETLK